MGETRFRRMPWPVTVIAGMAIAALPVSAQRGSGHSISGGMGISRSASAPSRPTSAPALGMQRLGAPHGNSFGARPVTPTRNLVIPHWETSNNPITPWELGPSTRIHNNFAPGFFAPGFRPNRRRVGFGAGFVGFPYYSSPFGYGNAWNWFDDDDYGQPSQPVAGARPEYAPQAPYGEDAYDYGYPSPGRPPYNPEAQQSSAPPQDTTQSDGLDHPPVTLVFNDGRPPVKVQSYVLTGSSIFVADPGHQRKIALADLDLPATIEQNREAGVDFQVPGAGN
jgi:hypothetical protein